MKTVTYHYNIFLMQTYMSCIWGQRLAMNFIDNITDKTQAQIQANTHI